MSNGTNEDQNFKKFLLTKFILESILIIPLVSYLFYLGYIYFKIRKMTVYFHKTFHYSLGLKKNWISLLIIFFVYKVCAIFLSYDDILISDQLIFILTIFLKICCCVFIIVLIEEQALKNLKTRSLHILFFFIIISLLLFLEIMNELRFEVFFNTFTLNSFGLLIAIYCGLIFIWYPNDLYYENFEILNQRLMELPSIYQKNKLTTIKNEFIRSSSDQFFPKNLTKSKIELVSDGKIKDISFDDIYKDDPEQIPIFPVIKVSISSKLEYNSSLPINNIKVWFDNFFININVFVDNPLTNMKIKRNLTQFIELNINMKNELTDNIYSSIIVNKYIPLKVNEIKSDGNTVKEKITNFLDNILKNPILITDSFLEFLSLNNINISDSFKNERMKFLKKEVKKPLIKDDFEFDYFIKESQRNTSRESMRFINDFNKERNEILIKDLTIDDFLIINNEYEFTITITYDLQLKTITKTLSEIESFIKDIDINIYNRFNVFFISPTTVKESIISFLESCLKTIVFNSYIDEEKNNIVIKFFEEIESLPSTSPFEITIIQNLANEKQICHIRVEIPSYTLLESYFKINVFYELFLFVVLKNNSIEKLNLKYKFKELIGYIDSLNFSLGIKSKVDVNIFYSNINEKLQKRKSLLEDCLNKIFMNTNIMNHSWTNIFHLNKAYRNYIEKQNQLTRQQSDSKYRSGVSFSIRPSVVSKYNY